MFFRLNGFHRVRVAHLSAGNVLRIIHSFVHYTPLTPLCSLTRNYLLAVPVCASLLLPVDCPLHSLTSSHRLNVVSGEFAVADGIPAGFSAHSLIARRRV